MLARHYSLIHADDFLENLLAFRLLWLGGRLRSGKTLMAMALARWLWENGLVDGVFTNIRTDPEFVPIVKHCYHACVILDEGWMQMDARGTGNDYKGYGALAGKLDSYWISSSKHAVDKRAADLRAKREHDIWILDSWLYRWEDEDCDKGWLLLRHPEDLFDTFDSIRAPVDDGGIMEALNRDAAAIGASVTPLELAGGRTRFKLTR